MVTTHSNIDPAAQLEKALSIIETQQLTIQNLQLQILQLKKIVFGSRHERFVGNKDENAPTLFDVPALAEVISTPGTTVTYEKTSKQLRPNHKGRNSFPETLRREEEILYPEGVDIATARKIGEDVTEILAYIPCELYVKKLVRPKFLDTTTNSILQAPAPERPFEKSSVDASLVSQAIVEKYVDHIPIYRQLKIYARRGVTISDSTMGDWFTAAANLLLPLYEAHKKLIISCNYLHADETTIKVLESERKGATHLGFYWVYMAHEQKLVLFDYQTGRGREGPRHILKLFRGHLQTDGYGVYDHFTDASDIILLGCLAHARRKFSDASSNNKEVADYVLNEIQQLYAIERYIADNKITGAEKLQYRKENSIPLLDELGKWMHKKYVEVLPKSAIAKALGYSIKRWDKLCLYATTSFLNIDNNPVENSIRPVALGRKNYLFAGSHSAAQRAAMFYSLLATCRNHDINPSVWLHDVLNRIATYPINRIAELLPHNWKPGWAK
jgi:transposase